MEPRSLRGELSGVVTVAFACAGVQGCTQKDVPLPAGPPAAKLMDLGSPRGSKRDSTCIPKPPASLASFA
eukprot:2633852-Pleurochrysis_carterae.AAC.1